MWKLKSVQVAFRYLSISDYPLDICQGSLCGLSFCCFFPLRVLPSASTMHVYAPPQVEKKVTFKNEGSAVYKVYFASGFNKTL